MRRLRAIGRWINPWNYWMCIRVIFELWPRMSLRNAIWIGGLWLTCPSVNEINARWDA